MNALRGSWSGGPRHRWLGGGLGLLGAIALLLGAVVATAWILFQLHGPEVLRVELERGLTTALGRPARVGVVTFRLWPAGLRASDVVVAAGPRWEDGLLLRLEHADIGARLESLWRRQIVLAVTLAGLDVTTTAGAAGASLASLAVPDTFAVGSLSLRVGAIGITRSRVLHRGPDGAWTVEVRGLEAAGRPAAGTLAFSARAESLRIESPTVQEHLQRLAAAGSVRAGEIAVRTLRLQWEGQELQVAGWLREPAAGLEMQATVRGQVELAAVARRVGQGGALAGRMRVDATVEGLVAAPRIEARVTAPELQLGPVRARAVRLDGTFADGTLRVRNLESEVFGNRVRGALVVTPEPSSGFRHVDVTLDGLRPPGALARLGPAAVRVQARVGAPGLELGPATARWADARLDITGRVDTGRRLALRVALDADLGRLARAAGALDVAGQAHVSAEATETWDRPVLTGRAEVTALALATYAVGRLELGYRLEASGGLSRWTGTLAAARIATPPVAIEDLGAAFTVDAERVDVQRLGGRVGGIPLVAHGSWTWAGAGQLDGDIGPALLAGLPGLPSGLALGGTGAGRLAVTRQTGVLAATAAIGLSGVAVGDVPLGAGQLQMSLAGRDVTAELSFPAVRLVATGGGRLQEERILSARARVERMELGPILGHIAPAARPHIRGTVSARAEAEVPVGRADALRVTAWIEPNELVVADTRWTSRAPARVAWEHGRLSMTQLRLAGALGTLTATGAVEAESGDGRVAIALEDARLPGALDRVGRGEVRAEAHITRRALEDVALRGDWRAGSLTLAGRLPFEEPMALRAELATDAAEVARAFGWRGATGRATLTAAVGGPWSEPVAMGRLEVPAVTGAGLTLTVVTVPFRLTRTALQIDGANARQGAGRLALDGSAAWGEGGGWRGRAVLTAPALVLGGWPLEAFHAAVALDARGLVVSDLATRVVNIPVRATGSWAWSGEGRLDGRLGAVRLAELPGLPPWLELAGTASGRLQASARSVDDVTARVALELTGVRAVGLALGDGIGAVELRGRAVRAELGFPQRRLTAVAEGPAAAGSTLAVRAAVDELSLEELVHRFRPDEPTAVGGALSARLQAEVPVGQPTAARGALRIDPLRLVVGGERLASREPLIVNFDGGALRVDRLALEGRAGIITGHGQLGASGALDAELRGRIPLALLSGFRSEVEQAVGTLDVTASIRGTTAAPAVSGEGVLRDGSLKLRGYPEPVRDIEARFAVSPGGLRVTEARGVLGSGTLTANGEAALAGVSVGAYRLVLAGRRVAASPLDGLSAVWDADLELAGRAARAQLTGEVRLVRGTYTRELAPSGRGAGAPAGGATGSASGLPLRVLVKLNDNLVIRNRTARLRIGGTLSVEGTTAAPVLLGAFETREGVVAFRERQFTVVSATARFVDPRRFDPFLDAVATARIREYDVTARVNGHADSLEVRLRSSPPLSQEDLLALVAFGVTRAELERSATGVLAGEAARVVVRDLLGFEAGAGPTESGEPGGRFQVGTRSVERTTPGEPQALASRREERVRVEYQLLGPLSLVGERGLSGGYAAGVVLRLRFR